MGAASPRWGSVRFGLGVASALTGVGLAAYFIAAQTSWLRVPELYAGLLAALLLVAARPLIDRLAAHTRGPSGPGAAWLGIAAGAAVAALTQAVALDLLFGSARRLMRPFSQFWEMNDMDLAAPVAAAVVAAACAAGAARDVVGVGPRRVRRLAWGVAALAAALTLAAGVRAARAPTMRGYVASLPLVGTASDARSLLETRPRESRDAQSLRYTDDRVGPLVLRRYMFERGWHCIPRLARSAAELPARIDRANPSTLVPCEAVAVRLDARHGVYFVDAVETDDYSLGPAVFDARSLAPLPESRVLNNARFADGMAVPRSWVLAAALLLAAALAALWRSSRRATAWLVCRSR